MFHSKSHSRSVGQFCSGSNLAVVVVTQRNSPGTSQLSVKGLCVRAGLGEPGQWVQETSVNKRCPAVRLDRRTQCRDAAMPGATVLAVGQQWPCGASLSLEPISH